MKIRNELDLINILENMSYLGELMSEELYKNSNYNDNGTKNYAYYWRSISSDLEKLKKEILEEE